MSVNQFKIALRRMRNDHLGAFVSITGLAVAFASVMVIAGYIWYEWGFDRQPPDSGRIFRLTFDETPDRDGGRHLATVSPPVGPALVRKYPEVEQAVRVRYTDDILMAYDDKRFYENGLIYADSLFFDFFPFPFAEGDPQTALQQPNSVVITPAIADKFFGKTKPLGRTLLLDGDRPLTVTGVLEGPPSQSHLDFSMVVSFSSFVVPPGYPVTLNSWGWVSFHTYIKLREGMRPEVFTGKMPAFIADHFNNQRAEKAILRLQPLRDVYFDSGGLMNTDKNRRGNRSYLYALSVIALLLLAVSVFNSLNLATARSVKRSMATSVRKVLGATRGQLVRQFVAEHILQSFISLAIGILLFEWLKNTVGKSIGWQFEMGRPEYMLGALIFSGLAVLLGISAGLYPSLLLSRTHPVEVLKGKLPSAAALGLGVRKILVLLQFAVTGGLVLCSLVVAQQMDFMKNKQPGYDREQVVALRLQDPNFAAYFEKAKKVFSENTMVLDFTSGEVLDGDYGSMPILLPQMAGEDAPAMHILGVGYGYFKTLGIAMADGREFSEDFPTDQPGGIILNEAAVRAFGLENPIGQQVELDNLKTGKVVGVVKDFHFHSLHDPIMPLVAFMPDTEPEYMLVRMLPGDLSTSIAALEDDWERIAPGIPFQYAFLDEAIQQQYVNDRRFSYLIYFFTTLTLFVALLGLYGLMVITVNARTKEIGVRKVLGANTAGIVGLLSKDFIKLVVIALLIASPVAYYFMNKWLQDFAYRIDIQWWFFAAAGLSTILIAFLTVAFQSMRAALANPVKSLRSE